MEKKAKKKVLFLITKSNFGGAQRYVYDLATNLDTTRWEPVVALGGQGLLKTKLETAGIRVIPIPNLARDISFKKELLSSWSIAQLIRTEDPDVLHVNSSKAGAIGAGLGRLLGVPRVIFTAHGWAFNEDRGRLSRLIIKTAHWLTVLFAHYTITVSDALRTQMNWPGVARKMGTIYLGRQSLDFLDKAAARTELATQVPELADYTNDIWTISIGELHPVKQHNVAITAIYQLQSDFPTLRHLIIGAGEQRSLLEADIKRLGLSENVFLCGHLDEAARYLKAADVFILPSRSEALGYVALEAAQAGVPAVASNVGGIPEIIKDGSTGTLVPSGDATALATAVNTYLTNPEMAADHAAAAITRSQQFSIDTMVAKTEAIYSNNSLTL